MSRDHFGVNGAGERRDLTTAGTAPPAVAHGGFVGYAVPTAGTVTIPYTVIGVYRSGRASQFELPSPRQWFLLPPTA